MCDGAREAGILNVTKNELRSMGTGEHESYWKTNDELANGSKSSAQESK